VLDFQATDPAIVVANHNGCADLGHLDGERALSFQASAQIIRAQRAVNEETEEVFF